MHLYANILFLIIAHHIVRIHLPSISLFYLYVKKDCIDDTMAPEWGKYFIDLALYWEIFSRPFQHI